MSWISIEDKVPPFDEVVVVCEVGDDDVALARLCSITKIQKASGVDIGYEWQEGTHSYDTITFNPTHWMPIPSIPQIAML